MHMYAYTRYGEMVVFTCTRIIYEKFSPVNKKKKNSGGGKFQRDIRRNCYGVCAGANAPSSPFARRAALYDIARWPFRDSANVHLAKGGPPGEKVYLPIRRSRWSKLNYATLRNLISLALWSLFFSLFLSLPCLSSSSPTATALFLFPHLSLDVSRFTAIDGNHRGRLA